MSIGSIAQNQSMETGSNHVTQSLTASKSTFTSKNTYADFVGDFETKRDTSNYDVVLPLPIGRNKKVIGVVKDKLDGRIITKFVGLRQNMYSYVTDDGCAKEKAKCVRKCVQNAKLNSKNKKIVCRNS